MRETIQYALFLVVPFAVQLAVLLATGKRFRPLRLAVPILVCTAGAAFILLCCLTAPPGWGLLLAPLVFIISLALTGLALVGCGLAWAVYYLIKRKASDTP